MPRVYHPGISHHRDSSLVFLYTCQTDQSVAVSFSLNVTLKSVVCAIRVFFGSLGVTFFSIVGLNVKHICDVACGKAPEKNFYSDTATPLLACPQVV